MSNSSSKLSVLHRTHRGLFLVCITAVLMTVAATPSWAAAWGYIRNVDEMTDRVLEIASITIGPAAKTVDISFFCSSPSSTQEPTIGVFTSSLLDYNSDKEITYLLRVDEKPAVNGTGLVPGAGKSFFIKGSNVLQIMNGLLANSMVKMRWPVYRDGNVMIQIPSEGLRPVLEKMSCIAPLLPPERAPAPAVSSPPTQPRTGEGSGF